MQFSVRHSPYRSAYITGKFDLNEYKDGQHTVQLGQGIDVKFTISQDHLNFGEPEEITDDLLNWSDIQNLHDIIIKLLDENTEILNKYEKINNAQFGDTDVKSEAYFTVNRGLKGPNVQKPPMKSATRHLLTECEVMPDVDPIFEDTLNKEYGFLDDDLERQVSHINKLFQMKTLKVDELEKKQSQIIAANKQQKKEITHLLKLMDDQRKQIELLQKTEIKACQEIKEIANKMQNMTSFSFADFDATCSKCISGGGI